MQKQFPSLATVEFYREDTERRGMKLPAVLLQLSEFESELEDDPGTDQLAVNAKFEAEIIFGFKTKNVHLEVRKFAAAFAAWLRLRRWTGVVTDAARVIGAWPDEFNPDLDEYVVWRVEWTQVLYLGCNEWHDTSGLIAGNQIFVGVDPNTGPSHLPDYTYLETDPTVINPNEL
jgi:hypothetical protein